MSLHAASQRAVQDGTLKGKVRDALQELLHGFARWREMLGRDGHVVTAATVLDESGYTEMWKRDKSPEAPAGWRTSRSCCGPWASSTPLPGSWTTSAWSWKTSRAARSTG